MKIFLFFFILFFFGIFILPVGSEQPTKTPMPTPTVVCREKLEVLYLKTQTLQKTQNEEESNADSNKELLVIDRWDICKKLSGQCKNQCGDKEFKMIYCEVPTVQCCIRECDPVE
ncbi:beta-defensin 112-like [Molossus molossus]|uniref:beta-defensin 112-like n=1 Tax=Molossus molossus TaxID=27622 RepID=UPI001746C4D6|nr:beta-defensin 112-like [Molossus molossus]